MASRKLLQALALDAPRELQLILALATQYMFPPDLPRTENRRVSGSLKDERGIWKRRYFFRNT